MKSSTSPGYGQLYSLRATRISGEYRRRFAVVLLGLLVGHSLPARAQTPAVKPADLVGTWRAAELSCGDKLPTGFSWLTLRADSLFWFFNGRDSAETLLRVRAENVQNKTNQSISSCLVGGWGAGRWRLVGDTLVLFAADSYYAWSEAQLPYYGTSDTAGMSKVPPSTAAEWDEKNLWQRPGNYYAVLKPKNTVSLSDQQLTVTPRPDPKNLQVTTPPLTYHRVVRKP